MPRERRRPPAMSGVGELIWRAMDEREAQTGERYTYTDLARDMEERTGRRRNGQRSGSRNWPKRWPALRCD